MYQYRENYVEKLRNVTGVKYVDKKRIEFTLDFRIQLFEKWKASPVERTIEEGLKEVGIACEDVTNHLCRELHSKFLMGDTCFIRGSVSTWRIPNIRNPIH